MDTERTEYTNESRVFHVGPCAVDSIMLAADGATTDCEVFDGVNDKAELKFHIEAISGTTFGWSAMHHANFKYGIYVKLLNANAKVTVMFNPKSPGEAH